jgi:hypothetical protein
MGRDCATASKLWRALTSHRDPEDHVVVALARSMAFRGLGKVGYVGKIVAKHDWPQRSRPLEERHEQNAHECSCEDISDPRHSGARDSACGGTAASCWFDGGRDADGSEEVCGDLDDGTPLGLGLRVHLGARAPGEFLSDRRIAGHYRGLSRLACGSALSDNAPSPAGRCDSERIDIRVLADFRCSGPLPTIPRFLNVTTVRGARL